MGRTRKRTDEENKTFDREYQRLYYQRRKVNDREYYNLTSNRCYYRKLLKNIDPNDNRYETISQKVSDLDERINEIINSRTKYARMNICQKVDAKIRDRYNRYCFHPFPSSSAFPNDSVHRSCN